MATPESLLAPLKEALTSGVIPPLSPCPSAPLSSSARGSVTCSICPWCRDKKIFKTGRISFNILSPYAKQSSQTSPGHALLQGRGNLTDGVFLLTSCLPRSFLGPGELHLAMKMSVYRLATVPNAPAEPESNRRAHSGRRRGLAEWCEGNRCACTLSLADLLQARRRPQQDR